MTEAFGSTFMTEGFAGIYIGGVMPIRSSGSGGRLFLHDDQRPEDPAKPSDGWFAYVWFRVARRGGC